MHTVCYPIAEPYSTAVPSRTFDILLALVERRERPVSKDELLRVVWPGRVVEEGNLTVHIARLRKLPGSNVIATLSGRGYRFVAPVEEVSVPTAEPGDPARLTLSAPEVGSAAAVPRSGLPGNPLPRLLTALVGRQDDLDRIEPLLQRSRLVSIVGAGGTEAEWPFVADDDWFAQYAPDIENLRAALTWSFGPTGDAALGVELTSYAEHVWTELSLAAELRHWFDLAISQMSPSTPRDVAGRLWLGRCGWLAIGDPQAITASGHAIENFRFADNELDLGIALWRSRASPGSPTRRWRS